MVAVQILPFQGLVPQLAAVRQVGQMQGLVVLAGQVAAVLKVGEVTGVMALLGKVIEVAVMVVAVAVRRL
jgi:hypothetical protein